MSKLRLLFAKEDQASYISHLDLMRTFQRVFLRTGLTIRHSAGFHPHPIMSIVLPLPVGQSSQCELLDIEVNESTDGHDVPQRLDQSLPRGLRILDCWQPQAPVRDLALLKATVELDYDRGVPAGTMEHLQQLFQRDSIIIQKRTKHKSLADVDIRPLIHEVAMEQGSDRITLHLTVSAQNPGLNPALLGQAIARELPNYAPDFLRVRREALCKADGSLFR